MDSFVVKGSAGKAELSGTIAVGGAKNAALPIMAAALMVEGEVALGNVPSIADVAAMAKLLEGLGAFVTREGAAMSIRSGEASGTVFDDATAKSLRASILLTAPVLARNGQVTFPHPGGDVIGERPIDIFISSFEKLGAHTERTDSHYTLSAPQGLSGGEIFFRIVSVTATEALMIAATRATSPVTLYNAALEPEVVALANFLNACGGRVEGAGTSTIVIFPSHLRMSDIGSHSFQIIPDRIEAATFLVLGALAGKDITVTGVEPQHLMAVTDALVRMGVPLVIHGEGQSIRVRAPRTLLPIRLRTHEYPGFPTDAQPPFAVLLTQADGESDLIESIFDGRLNYTAELVRMGANIEVVNPHKAIIKGTSTLKARDIDGPDIRAGLAFLLAAAIADGESRIGNAHLIDRGYEMIETKLTAVGLPIRREKS